MSEHTYLCCFVSGSQEEYSEVPMHFLPRQGDIVQNSGAMEKVLFVEYGFNLGKYYVHTEHLGIVADREKILGTLRE